MLKLNKKNIIISLFGMFMLISGSLLFFIAYPENTFVDFSESFVIYGSKFTNFLRCSVNGIIKDIQISRNAEMEIQELKKEISYLRDLTVDYYDLKRENTRLVKYCEIKKQNPEMKFVSADLVGWVPMSTYGKFIINSGTSQGISIGDPVTTENGLIGSISRAGANSSTVQTLFSNATKIGALDTITGNVGIITGVADLTERSYVRLELLPSADAVKEGDMLQTTGISGLYPKGLKIGKVKEIEYDSSNSMYCAKIETYEKIKDTQNVFVITDFSGKNVININ
ncbi:MAG: rod shape-determining protein MreC [Candidatus Improbicoccus devescovinae]|nr:MAG: rod shape-determining protein MreC [Candidatus Improbicoccus devescovinae]